MFGITPAQSNELAAFSGGADSVPDLSSTFASAFSFAFSTETRIGLELLRAYEHDKLVRDWKTISGQNVRSLRADRNVNITDDVLAHIAELPEGERKFLPTRAQFDQRVAERIQGKRARAGKVLQRGRGFAQGAVELAGGISGFTLDPIVLATLPVGGIAVGVSKGVGRAALLTAAREGALGAVAGAGSALLANPVQEEAGIPLTSPLTAAVYAGLGGASLGFLFGGGAALFRRRRVRAKRRELEMERAGLEAFDDIVANKAYFRELAESVGYRSDDVQQAYARALDKAYELNLVGEDIGLADVPSIMLDIIVNRKTPKATAKTAPEAARPQAEEIAGVARAAQKAATKKETTKAKVQAEQAGVKGDERPIPKEKVDGLVIETKLLRGIEFSPHPEVLLSLRPGTTVKQLPRGFSVKAGMTQADPSKFTTWRVELIVSGEAPTLIATGLSKVEARKVAQKAVVNEMREALLEPKLKVKEPSGGDAQRAAKRADEATEEGRLVELTDNLEAQVREELAGGAFREIEGAPFRLSAEELDALLARSKVEEAADLLEALGTPERVKLFEKLDRQQNSSNPAVADKAAAEFKKEFGTLTAKQERLIFGEASDPRMSTEEIKTLLTARNFVESFDPDDTIVSIGREISRGMRNVSKEEITKTLRTGRGPVRVHEAIIQIEGGRRELLTRGLSNEAIDKAILDGMESVGFSRADAREVLSSFAAAEKAARGAARASPEEAAILKEIETRKIVDEEFAKCVKGAQGDIEGAITRAST
jgi:hypothetical protein